ncbi:MAG: hypothetical protein AB8G86_28500 [Saprospiraceae bacterium]
MKNLAVPFFIISLSLGMLSLTFPINSQKNIASTIAFNQPQNCVYTYILEAKKGLFTISLLPNQTIKTPFNTTATAQITLKVSTGSFQVANLENLIEGVEFTENGRSNAPTEAPKFDYIVFGLTSIGTRNITYTKDTKIPLFSFTNSGECTGAPIYLMDNFNDPFYLLNSQKANVSQQITVAQTGSDLSIICNDGQAISDCGEKLKRGKKRKKAKS